MKKVFFVAALVLLSAHSSFAFWNFHKGTTHTELLQPHTLDKASSKAAELADLSNLLDPGREAAGRIEDLSKAEMYACPIELGKLYSRSSAAGDDVNETEAKKCTGGMP